MGLKRRVIVEIDVDGATTVEVEGGAGPGCKALTAGIEAALGTVQTVRRKREYSQTGLERQQVDAKQ